MVQRYLQAMREEREEREIERDGDRERERERSGERDRDRDRERDREKGRETEKKKNRLHSATARLQDFTPLVVRETDREIDRESVSEREGEREKGGKGEIVRPTTTAMLNRGRERDKQREAEREKDESLAMERGETEKEKEGEIERESDASSWRDFWSPSHSLPLSMTLPGSSSSSASSVRPSTAAVVRNQRPVSVQTLDLCFQSNWGDPYLLGLAGLLGLDGEMREVTLPLPTVYLGQISVEKRTKKRTLHLVRELDELSPEFRRKLIRFPKKDRETERDGERDRERDREQFAITKTTLSPSLYLVVRFVFPSLSPTLLKGLKIWNYTGSSSLSPSFSLSPSLSEEETCVGVKHVSLFVDHRLVSETVIRKAVRLIGRERESEFDFSQLLTLQQMMGREREGEREMRRQSSLNALVIPEETEMDREREKGRVSAAVSAPNTARDRERDRGREMVMETREKEIEKDRDILGSVSDDREGEGGEEGEEEREEDIADLLSNSVMSLNFNPLSFSNTCLVPQQYETPVSYRVVMCVRS
jgi:hypothetical protein